MDKSRPIDLKVGVKPVFVQLLHSAAYEGPCRVGRQEDLDPEKEKQRGKEQFRKWTQQVENELSQEVRLLEPVTLQWKDNWNLPDDELGKLDVDAGEVDLYVVSGGLAQYPAVAVSRRFRKPVAMVGTVVTVDVAACLRSRGLEGYAPLDFEELNRLISLLRVRKAIAQTRILHALEGDLIPVGVVSSIHNLEDLHDRLGVGHVTVPARDSARGEAAGTDGGPFARVRGHSRATHRRPHGRCRGVPHEPGGPVAIGEVLCGSQGDDGRAGM